LNIRNFGAKSKKLTVKNLRISSTSQAFPQSAKEKIDK